MTKLLVVEDDKNLRLLYKEELQKEGYEIIAAKNGFEAIQQLKDNNPDLVILDMRLPDLNGVLVLSRMIEINKYLPIIITSAYYCDINDFRCWGAKAFLDKSDDITELKNKVAELLIRAINVL